MSVQLIGAQPTYVLGESADNGIVIRLNAGSPSLSVCLDDIGDVVGSPLWNGGTAVLRALTNETWEVPTGRTIEVPI